MFSKMFLTPRIHYGAKLIHCSSQANRTHVARIKNRSLILSRIRRTIKKKVSLDLFVSLPPSLLLPSLRAVVSCSRTSSFPSFHFPLVHHSFSFSPSRSALASLPPLPLFLAPSIFSQSPSPFFHLFPNCLYVRPLRTKEGETGADNDLMYGPVMSLVGGRTPLFPLRNEEQITRVDRITRQRKVRKHEIFIRKIPARAAFHPVSMYSNRLRRYRDTRSEESRSKHVQ